jgi:hypothetical protein
VADEWEVRTETRIVVRLYRNGKPTVDMQGKPYEYPSVEVAQHVADHWDDFRIPAWENLQAMSDDEVKGRLRRCLKLGLR